jgi:DNA-binding transcriptional LysR family regulator
MGIARVPSFIAGPFIRDGRVKPLFVTQEDVPLGIHALYPPARHLALKVRALVDFLAARFRGQPEWDRGW